MKAKSTKTASVPPLFVKINPHAPALIVTGPSSIAICAGTRVAKRSFRKTTPLKIPRGGLKVGADYGVTIDGLRIEKLPAQYTGWKYLGGFHFAPGGNAAGHAGGNNQPAINPCSVWDLNFRPSCRDPRGMALIEGLKGKFWCDIYLTGVDHLTDGTSKFSVPIADGRSPPRNLAGGNYDKFDYPTACAVMKHHGKGLLSLDEFSAATAGVTEKTAFGADPKITGLDAARTSKFGLMQATGNMWVWGHDGDPDAPRASIFGGSWLFAGDAGSRYALVGYVGRRVREARLAAGQTQEWLADKLGITFQQVQKYEKGTNRISPSRLYAVAKLFEREIGWFFPENDEASAPADKFAELATTSDGHRLVSAYLGIPDKKLHGCIVDLAEACAERRR
jgi:transcriptional regulator with XRE-family HTH domain